MYAQIDAVGIAKTTADAEVLKDRQRYISFFETAERYAAENGLIIGGMVATELLLGNRPGRDSYRYELYSERAGKHARGLAVALCDSHPALAHYTEMRPRVPGFEFSIYVDARELFFIRMLPGAVVMPSLRPANFVPDLQLQCMGPEVQLIDTYATLADPSRVCEWLHLLEVEATLRKILLGEVRGKIGASTTGPGRRTELTELTEPTEPTGGSQSRPEPSSRANILSVLLRHFVGQPGHVVVGPFAYSQGTTAIRLQVVSQNGLEHEEKEIRRLLREHGVVGDFQGSCDDPKIPADVRIRRLTMYCRNRGRREAFMDVFNVGEHELVPFVEGGDYVRENIYPVGLQQAERRAEAPAEERRAELQAEERQAGQQAEERAGQQAERQGRLASRRRKPRERPRSLSLSPRTRLGTPFVLMRFRLIDLWTLRLLLHYGAISPEYARRILHEVIDGFEAIVAGYLTLLRRMASAPGEVEQLAGLLLPAQAAAYIGRYETPHIAKKRWSDSLRRERTARGSGARRFQPPFFPCVAAPRGHEATEAAQKK